MPAPPPTQWNFRKRYLAAIVVAATAALFTFIANDGNPNPSVAEYFSSPESRLGYWMLLGNTRHCGLYPKGQWSPFPIGLAQRKMEDKLYDKLGLANESRVLDAGAGSGYVAMRMAERGLRVQAIDITPVHVADAKRNIAARGFSDRIAVQYGDYHDLSEFGNATFDGVYTMETFVHADDPVRVLRNFYRLLRPGGVLVHHEVDIKIDSDLLQEVLRLSHCLNTRAEGTLEAMLAEVGFTEIELEDLHDEVLPLWRLFGVIGFVPYQMLRAVGLGSRFTNLMAGVEGYLHWDTGRYISVRAVKP